MDELISKKAAIDAVNCVTVMKGIRSGKSITAEAVDCAKRTIADNIRQLPPIQPKRGYWIKTGDKEETYGTVSKCSVCGVIDYEGNFCPNCGAKMEVTDG